MRLPLTALAVAAALPATALPALAALNIPGIQGHMTDPGHRLSDAAKTAVEDKLGKIAEDTHIDVAGWITNAPDDQVVALGNEAYKRWSIGVYWDNGVFFAFPAQGRVHIIQDPAHRELTAEEETRLLAADVPSDDYQKRIEKLGDVTRDILVPKTQNKARPWGTNRPTRGNYFLIAALAVALAAVALSLRRRKPDAAQPIAPALPAASKEPERPGPG